MWYYTRNGVKQGPISGRELKELVIKDSILPTDLVWKEGMADWVAAKSVKGLFPTPPPITTPPTTPKKKKTDSLPTHKKEPYLYAGFWLRVAAYSIDCIILALPIFMITNAYEDNETVRWLEITLIAAVYSILFEASSWQATPGKKLLGLIVTDKHGKRISIARSSIRFLVNNLSYFTLFLSCIIVAFTEKKQALHDFAAETFVVKSNALSDWESDGTASKSSMTSLQRGVIAAMIFLFLLLPIVGILAAIAIPAYQDYEAKVNSKSSQQVVSPQQANVETEAEQHYNKIFQAYPDANEIHESDSFQEWLYYQPESYSKALDTGTAEEVIAVFDAFMQYLNKR